MVARKTYILLHWNEPAFVIIVIREITAYFNILLWWHKGTYIHLHVSYQMSSLLWQLMWIYPNVDLRNQQR